MTVQNAYPFSLHAVGTEKVITLADFAGRFVVLFFYSQDESPMCTIQMCNLRDRFDEFVRMEDVQVLAINSDSLEQHERFAQQHSLPFPLLSDPDHQVAEAYGAWGEEKFLGKTFLGVKRTTVIIDRQGRIAHIFGKVHIRNHLDEVMGVLTELRHSQDDQREAADNQ